MGMPEVWGVGVRGCTLRWHCGVVLGHGQVGRRVPSGTRCMCGPETAPVPYPKENKERLLFFLLVWGRTARSIYTQCPHGDGRVRPSALPGRRLANGRVFCTTEQGNGVPDGIRCDEHGNLWVSVRKRKVWMFTFVVHRRLKRRACSGMLSRGAGI